MVHVDMNRGKHKKDAVAAPYTITTADIKHFSVLNEQSGSCPMLKT